MLLLFEMKTPLFAYLIHTFPMLLIITKYISPFKNLFLKGIMDPILEIETEVIIQLLVQVCSIRNHKRKSIYYKIRFDVLMSNKKVMQKN